jgi:hypothetical protein
MEETTVSIIGIIIASILMFIVPLVTIADRNDDISQLTVQTLTSEFVDNIIRVGKITSEDYDKFIVRLSNSGNTYDMEMEVKILDENPSIVTTDASAQAIGSNLYYSIYTSQIEQKLASSTGNGTLLLKEGDIISVTVKNNSKTMSQSLKSIYYTFSGADLHIIAATSSGTIAVSGTT